MTLGRVTALFDAPGVSCMEAHFKGQAFAPHSHDTYAIGYTTTGVQAFDYRGEKRLSLPGDVFVLHPCERHDGRQGDDRGYGYRIAYIDPVVLREAIGTDGLPFVSDPVVDDDPLKRAVVSLLMKEAGSDNCLDQTDSLTRLADRLAHVAQLTCKTDQSVDERAMTIARDFLSDSTNDRTSISDLESATGLTRWRLTRQFRKAFGSSPYQFHLYRRLDRVRAELECGMPLAQVAIRAGFADQAHMSRHFKRSFGVSPGTWRSFARSERPSP